MASEFAYFGPLVFFVLILYTTVLAVFLCIRRHNIKKAIEYRNIVRGRNDAEQDRYDRANFSFEFRTDFDHVTQSALGKGCKWFLALQRTACLVVFFVAAVYLNAIKDNKGLVYFTNWNSLLVTLFFGLASLSSWIGMWGKANRTEYGARIGANIRWSYLVRCLGMVVHLLFEIVGASSMFVMIFDFFYIHEANPDMMSVMNFLRALAVVVLVFELFLNNINVRFDQYPATIAWTVMYLLFVWPAVFTGTMHQWPYRLLQTRTRLCFVYYFLIFVFNFLLYVLWWGVYKIKKSIYIRYNIGRYMDYGDEEMEISPHEFMLLERTMNPLSMHGMSDLPAAEIAGAEFYDDEGHSVAYTIDGFPIDIDLQGEGAAYAEEAGLLYNPNVFEQPAYFAEDGFIVYPGQYQQYGYHGEQPFSPGGYAADGSESSYYGSGPYSYEQHSPLVHPNTGYPDPQHAEFHNRQPWAAASPQYRGHWDYGHGAGQLIQEDPRYPPHDPAAAPSGYEDISGEGYYDDGGYPMDEGLTPTGREDAPNIADGTPQTPLPRRLPARPYAGSALERGRGGRGAGRRGSGQQPPVTQQPTEPISVVAELLEDDAVAQQAEGQQGQEPAEGFDYSVVDAWQSFNASGAIPHSAAEAGVSGKSAKMGGLFAQFGWGGKGDADSAPTPVAGKKAGGPKPGGGWFNSVDGDGQEDEDYDEEYDFGDAEQSQHKSGAFIASAAKKEAFHVPGTLQNARRKSGDPTRLQAAPGPGQAAASPRALPRPPSLQKMFKPPSVPRMFRPASKESLNLQTLGSAASSNNRSFRKASASRMPGLSRQGSMDPQYASEALFDYRDMDAWASFNARGVVPHNPQEADLGSAPTIRVGGVGDLDPHKEIQRSGEKGTPARGALHGAAAMEGYDEGEEDGAEEHPFIPESTPDTHKTGAFIATVAKKEAFHAPVSTKSARSHHPPASAATTPPSMSGQKASPEQGANASSGPGGMLRPPSLGNLFRSSSRERLSDGRRPLNLQALGSPSAAAAGSAAKDGGSGGGGLFRPPSVTRMFRSSSKEAITPPKAARDNHNSSFRKASASRMPGLSRQGSMDPQYASEAQFDYRDMDAWASFNARGVVPHNPAEADLGSAPTIRVGGVGDLDPHKEVQRSGQKVTGGGGWFDNTDGFGSDSDTDARRDEGGDGEAHFIPESTPDTHKTGAYIATAAQKEAFRPPPSLFRGSHLTQGALVDRAQSAAKGVPMSGQKAEPAPSSAPPAAAAAPATGSGFFRAFSGQQLVRPGSRGDVTQPRAAPAPAPGPGRRPVNLQALGAASTTPIGNRAPIPVGGNTSGMFRPPSVTRLFRAGSRGDSTALPPPPGTTGAANTAAGCGEGKALTSQTSFFDYPTADGAAEGSDSGDSDDAFRL